MHKDSDKLYDYDRGQDYIAISDYIAEKLQDHHDTPELIKEANRFRAYLGDRLKELGSHCFDIYDSDDYRRNY